MQAFHMDNEKTQVDEKFKHRRTERTHVEDARSL